MPTPAGPGSRLSDVEADGAGGLWAVGTTGTNDGSGEALAMRCIPAA